MAFFSKKNFLRMKEGAYAITLDEKKCRGTRWVLLSVDRHTAVRFSVFEIEYIPQEVLNKIKINQLLTIYLEYQIMNLLGVKFILLLS